MNVFEADFLIGLAVGLVQGYFFNPILKGSYEFFVYLIARVIPSVDFAKILGIIPALSIWGCFMLSSLLFKSTVTIWKTFVLGLIIGFFISALAYKITHPEPKNPYR